ncbi:acyl-CoA N-acyltransferase [Scenedesmus sp. NREL 46B-D3]|nr:acyl-CoA N-acyltransferase [Scenedesmus sp. NREL 46B-D3]
MTITIKPIAQGYLAAVRTLNSVIFPVKYHDRVYQDALACGPVSQLAFEGDTLVGAILCRLEALPGGAAQLYIISLGVLAPCRGAGIGSQLLAASLASCEGDPAIKHALLHVHTGNTEALEFYRRKGFTVTETIAGYYKRIDPPDAAVLVKQLRTYEQQQQQQQQTMV